jgi:BMFP domain-containing protein YqiC
MSSKEGGATGWGIEAAIVWHRLGATLYLVLHQCCAAAQRCSNKSFLLHSSLCNMTQSRRPQMLSQKLFEEITTKISETIAASPVKDVEKNVKAMMASTFSRLDLVTREEFDVQQEVLLRTREKLERLEARLATLEAAVFPDKAAEQVDTQATLGHS